MLAINDKDSLQTEKKLLKDKISQLEYKQNELSKILKKKNDSKMATMGVDSLDPCKTTMVNGLALDDFRISKMCKTSSVSLLKLPKDDPKAVPVKETSNLAKLRIQHLRRNLETKIISSDIFDNNKNRFQNENTILKTPKATNTLFPIRYKRGELPCSIEFGASIVISYILN